MQAKWKSLVTYLSENLSIDDFKKITGRDKSYENVTSISGTIAEVMMAGKKLPKLEANDLRAQSNRIKDIYDEFDHLFK